MSSESGERGERLLNLTFRENGMIYSDQPVTNCFIQQNQFREGAEINGKFCENVLQNPFSKLLDL